MVRHNNQIPNQHFHKDWQNRVKTWFDQPAKKKARRLKRKAKAAAVAPRPTQLLRPVVHAPTQRYNHKTRLGKGFTMQELKEAGISPKYAKSVGIAVDHRRTNLSVESLQANVQRLKEYTAKLLVFPQGRVKKAKNAAELKNATQAKGTVLPLPTGPAPVEFVAVTDELKAVKGYTALRVARNEVKLDGIRKGKAGKGGDDKAAAPAGGDE